ncbi:binding-protein-dependent transport systems inner membrane component [Caldicellulosiruptor hydrothermalis 108]|uniref:Binding-protein-dependent transport systems inner membrane component n=2 Tax=Caldicellulosiruptor TaxID=44000 RepID=E4QC54_CALH1|nr:MULTISPECIES: carbohydrate ABC transporter permease [Caldicellulosiruptor]ADQ07346.1 binding-protein-dependent transport systems inner membrane component [Caldicellulosiruptor hydrothermalis 108]BCS81442.1 sugar ABC transporter permease [Caldicellulosiruptor diazotrophicus]
MNVGLTKKNVRVITALLTYLILTAGAIIMILPLLWMLSTALKEKEAAFLLPPRWIPNPIKWNNFINVFKKGPILSGFKNSLIVATTVISVGTFTSSLAAFSFAKLKFPGKDKIFLMLLGTIMIPYPVVMIPQFVMFSKIHWTDTLLPLIVPGMFGNVMMIFFLKQNITSISDSLIDAAKIDGCGYFKMYYKIILPLVKHAVATQIILWFVGIWNDYLAPLIYLNSPEKMTIQVVIASFNSFYAIQNDYPLIMAASLISMLPIIVVFMIFQKQIIESIMISGIKE